MLFLFAGALMYAAAPPPAPLPPVPTPAQLAWQEMEYGMFCHFGINTFHNEEWTDGSKDPATFNPAGFDARQWVESAKAAGMKYLVFTAKHHDGFALYPTRFSDYSVAASPWRGGKGDAVRAVADACHELGVMFGFYVSPWDRHEPKYADPPAYDEHFKNMLRELLTNYGRVGEVWFDGAGSKGHTYDWAGYYALIRELQPDALIAICGPDIRWVGNEDGLAPDTLWNVQERQAAATSGETATEQHWYPAECDVPIRTGQWFFHTDGEKNLRPLDELLDIWYRSVGHGAVLLLNVSPDRCGLLPEPDVARLMELNAVLSETFRDNLAVGKSVTASQTRAGDPAYAPANVLDGDTATYWCTDDDTAHGHIEIDFGAPAAFDRIAIREHIALGQRVARHRIEARVDGAWRTVAEGTTVGHLRVHRFAPVTADAVRLVISESRACPLIQEVGVYKAGASDVYPVTD